jgi:hypothetical protein
MIILIIIASVYLVSYALSYLIFKHNEIKYNTEMGYRKWTNQDKITGLIFSLLGPISLILMALIYYLPLPIKDVSKKFNKVDEWLEKPSKW